MQILDEKGLLEDSIEYLVNYQGLDEAEAKKILDEDTMNYIISNMWHVQESLLEEFASQKAKKKGKADE